MSIQNFIKNGFICICIVICSCSFSSAQNFSDPYLELCSAVRDLDSGKIKLETFVSQISTKQRKALFGVFYLDGDISVQLFDKPPVRLQGLSGLDEVSKIYAQNRTILVYYYWKEILSELEFQRLDWPEPSDKTIKKEYFFDDDTRNRIQKVTRKNLIEAIITNNSHCLQ